MKKNSAYILNFDLFRAIAITLVLYSHILQQLFSGKINNTALYDIGKHGVTLFFILSGFLIGSIYYKASAVNPLTFWLKRFLRTFPPYLVILVVSWLAVSTIRGDKFDWSYVFMVQNYYDKIPYFLISWSMCVQEHFYLLFSIFIVFLKKEHHIWVWGSLTILPILFRLLFGSIDGNVEFGYNITATHFQIDSIAFGVFSSCLLHQKPSFIRNKYLSSIGWLLITIGISYILSLWQYKYFPLYVLGPTVLNISGTLLLLSLYFNKPLRLASTSLVKTTSKMAYSIYLVHSLVIHVTIYFFNRYHINQLAIQVLVTTSCIFATAYIFYILIERPTVKYRNKWLKI